jgi:hypothetical protein
MAIVRTVNMPRFDSVFSCRCAGVDREKCIRHRSNTAQSIGADNTACLAATLNTFVGFAPASPVASNDVP